MKGTKSKKQRRAARDAERQRVTPQPSVETPPLWDRGVSFPLYFGWEARLALRKIADTTKQIVGPFKTYRGYFSAIVVVIVVVSGIFFFGHSGSLRAAQYDWVQTVWDTLAPGVPARHPDNQTGWTKYEAADANIQTGNALTLSPAAGSSSQTSDTDFDAGTYSSTERTGTGVDASVRLLQTAGGTVYSDTTDAQGVTISGNYAYLADGTDGLVIEDVTDPLNPVKKSSYNASGIARDVAVYGNYAYFAPKVLGNPRIVNITDKSNPSFVDYISIPGGGNAHTVLVNGSYLYVGVALPGCGGYCTGMKIYVYSLADPAVPALTGSHTTYFGDPRRMMINGNFLYVAGEDDDGEFYNHDLNIYNIGTPGAITGVVNYLVLPGLTHGANDVGVSGNYAFMADGANGIKVINITNPASPSVAATYTTNITDAEAIEISGTTAYVGNGTSITSLNISNPLAITQNTSYALTGTAYHDTLVGADIFVADGASGLGVIGLTSFATDGTFVSSAIDTGGSTTFTTGTWTTTTPSGTTATVRMRSSNASDMSGAADWATCSDVGSGSDYSSSCAIDGQRYLQYRVALHTNDPLQTPLFSAITLNYQQYPASQTLTSSMYDTRDSTNVVANLRWTESIPSGTDVKFQISTAPDASGSPGAWTAFLGPTGTGDYYSTPTGNTINASQATGNNDEWVQYKVWLVTTDRGATPTLSDATLTYVVNAPPEFQGAPTAVQQADGTVLISYAVRDPDADSGSGFVTPSFEYSTDAGGSWHAMTNLSAGATDPKAVEEDDFRAYNATWTAKQQSGLDGTFSNQMQIRITIDDGELANRYASAATANFTLDAQNPALGDPPLMLDARTVPATVTLSVTDNSSLQMEVSANSDFSGASWQPYDDSFTTALETDPDTLYAKFRDAFGNTTATVSAVTPETPTHMIIRDITNVDASDYKLFVSWKTVADPTPGFANYLLYSSTDGRTYTLLTSIPLRSTNFYVHSSLTPGTRYYYRVATEDHDENISYYSSSVDDVPNGQGGTDSTPPSITNVGAAAIGTQTATISWDTDELSNSSVGYSATRSDFSSTKGVETMVDNAAGVGRHTVVLTNLLPGTTYYYRVTSEDPTGNSASDTHGGDGYTFTTLSGPVISNVSTQEVLNTEATITWLTDIPADSHLYYSPNADLSGALEVGVTTPLTTTHLLTLTNLTHGTIYYYYVASGVAFDNNAGRYYSFVTTTDSVPPQITAVSADPVFDTKAVLQWTTDEKATSQAAYGTSSGSHPTTTTLDDSANSTHSVTLSGLQPKTTYYFVVVSTDQSGNTQTSSEGSFTTLDKQVLDSTPPVLSSIAVGGLSASEATVTWTTDESANSFVQFGTTTSYGTVFGNWKYVSAHTVTVTGLSATTLYHARVISVDAFGNFAQSDDLTFTTKTLASETSTKKSEQLQQLLNTLPDLADNIPVQDVQNTIAKLSELLPLPIIGGAPIVSVTATTASIAWTTDKDANTRVAYATQADYQPNAAEPYANEAGNAVVYEKKHVVTLTGLLPETTYHYQIRTQTPGSNQSRSTDYTFTTDKKAFAIENYSSVVESDQTAVFRWTTSEAADSAVKVIPYRGSVRAVNEVQTFSESDKTPIHQVRVDIFESGVVYDLEIISTLPDGVQTSKVISGFTTNVQNTPPAITQIQTDSALSPGENVKVQTIISWNTNEPATSRVYYRKGVASGTTEFPESSPADAIYTRRHIVVLTTFDPGSVYQFQVESIDSSGQVAKSKPLTVLTPQLQKTVFQVIFGAVEQTFGWTKLFNQ